ncbi:MAG TPA: hypothetical protein VFL64_03210 [Rhizobacter sp.]|nr:hypothetical protein [Rhizobacter sp.]
MNDDDVLLRFRKRLQELDEARLTGFVNEAQHAEGKAHLLRQFDAAVAQRRQEVLDARFAPTMLFDPSDASLRLPLPRAAAAPRRPPLWWWAGAALLALSVAGLLGWWAAARL